MTEPDVPTGVTPTPKPASPLSRIFTQANVTLGLAVFAVILAGAPYLVPQVQSFVVEKGLLNRPTMLALAQTRLETQTAEAAAIEATMAIKAHHDSIFNDKDDPVIGNPHGQIKVAEFLDYLCAYCRAATPEVQAFLAQNPDVTLVVKEYPVIHPPASQTLAAYGIAASKGGHYEAVHYALLTEKIETQSQMDAILTKAQLDPRQVEVTAKAQATLDQINKTLKLGENLKINGTPTFIVGDKMVTGLAGLSQAVQAERAKLKKS